MVGVFFQQNFYQDVFLGFMLMEQAASRRAKNATDWQTQHPMLFLPV